LSPPGLPYHAWQILPREKLTPSCLVGRKVKREGPSLNRAFLTLKSPASSVYVRVLEASSPLQRSISVMTPFPSLGWRELLRAWGGERDRSLSHCGAVWGGKGHPLSGTKETWLAPNVPLATVLPPPSPTAHAPRSSGSAVDAARRAGYSTPHPVGVNILRNATFSGCGRSFASLVFDAS